MTEGIVRIKRGREKPIRNRHPWVFSGAIAHAENAANGELVTVADQSNRFLARGYWNSKSQIQVRIMTWRDEPIDDSWWRQKLITRHQRSRPYWFRRNIGLPSGQCGKRLYPRPHHRPLRRLVCRASSDPLCRRTERAHCRGVLSAVTDAEHVYERSDVDARAKEGLGPSVGLLRGGPLPELVEIEESARFLVDIQGGHKTGFYLDQRENRHELADLISRCIDIGTAPVKLLNLFSYSGGFAVAAGRFDRVRSVNVDSSYSALELAEKNFKRNGYDPKHLGETAEFIQADGFDYLHHAVQEGDAFDIVVLDPPKFVQNKGQVQRAARGYKNLNLNAFKLVKEGGYLMTFSCSGAISRDLFQKIVFGALADSGRQAQIVKHLHSATDHPVALTFPEGEYLKGLLLRVY